MSQEGLVSSNHYVVRIYPLILPPSALFPLPPPIPFISLPLPLELRLPYNSPHAIFSCFFFFASQWNISPHSCLRPIHLSDAPFEFFFGVFRSALCLVCRAATHINRFVLEMFSGTNRVIAHLLQPIFCCILSSVCVCICVYAQSLKGVVFRILP